MDIGKAFGTNKTKEEKGVWVKGPLGSEYLIAREGNKEFTRLSAELVRPYRKMIQKGMADASLMNEIAAEVVARTVLLDWRKVRDPEGKPIPYTPEEGKRCILAYPDFAEFVSANAREMRLFQDEEQKAAEGN